MSKLNLAMVAVSIVLSTATAFAQTTGAEDRGATTHPENQVAAPSSSSVPAGTDPLIARTDTGLDKVANDGVSTRVVPAVGCGTAARETDGTTTCIGIPGSPGSINAISGSPNREK